MHAPLVGPYLMGNHRGACGSRRLSLGRRPRTVFQQRFVGLRSRTPRSGLSSSHGRGFGHVGFRHENARAFERFEWLERQLSRSKLPTLIIWGREDEVFDAATFSNRFRQMLPHAEGPHLVTGRHFLQEDSALEIAGLIRSFLDRLDAGEGGR